jgi:hypothetical protein
MYHIPAEYLELRELQTREKNKISLEGDEGNTDEKNKNKKKGKDNKKVESKEKMIISKKINENKNVSSIEENIKKDDVDDIFGTEDSSSLQPSAQSSSSSSSSPSSSSPSSSSSSKARDYPSALCDVLSSQKAREFWMKFRKEGCFDHKTYLQCQVFLE